MDWVLDHLQVLFIVAVAVAAVLQRFKASSRGGRGRPPPVPDPESAERTRRIQAEIRRRIRERRPATSLKPNAAESTEMEPPIPELPPLLEEIRSLVAPPPAQPEEPMEVSPPPAPEVMPQQRTTPRMEELEAARAARREPAATGFAMASEPVQLGAHLVDLREPSSLRRAVIWREILGPPAGLR